MKICTELNFRQQLAVWAVALAALFSFSTAVSAQTSLWTDISNQSATTMKAAPHRGDHETASRQMALNLSGMIEHLAQAPGEMARGRRGPPGTELQVDLPHPDGPIKEVIIPFLICKFTSNRA